MAEAVGLENEAVEPAETDGPGGPDTQQTGDNQGDK